MPGPATTLRFRPVGPQESLNALFDLDDLAFHENTPPTRRASLSEQVDREDTLCAYDRGRLVGSSVVWPLTLSVPGAQLACGAVSWVAVAPTHRRRGILSTMMGAQLNRLAEAGTPLAALWASEATIYGRFGYGVATWAHSYDIRVRDSDSGLRSIAPDHRVALLEPAEAPNVLGPIYDRATALRAGALSRDERWWTHAVLADPEEDRDGGPLRIVVSGDPADGYALYRTIRDDRAPSVLEVKELVAASPAAVEALWSYLLSVDLVGRVKAPLRPSDDPLALMLSNHRTAERTERDGLWIRLLDLPRALSGRVWRGSFTLVLEVQDHLLPANAGRWQLTNRDGQARCERTSEPSDVVLDTSQLAAIYLGGGSLTRARDAGLVEERTPGVVETLDHAAATVRAPWNVAVF